MPSTSTAAPETLTRKALIGTGWSAGSTIGRQVLSFVFSAILARRLGPGAYGLMGMVALVGAFLLNFRDLGTTTAIIQRPAVNERLLSTMFWVNAGLGVTLCLFVLAAALPAARFFKEPQLAAILAVSSISFVVASAGLVHSAVMNRNMDFRRLGLVDILSGLAGYMVAVPCAFAGLGVWSLVFGNLANAASATALYWRFAGWTPRAAFDLGELKSVRAFSLNLSGAGFVNYFSRNADNIVVGKYLGEIQLGFYQMAYNLMLYPIQNISFTISQVLRPALAKIQEDRERFRSAYLRSCMLIGLATFPVVAGMGVLADPLIRALLGPKWIPVIFLFQIFAPVGLVQSIQTTVGLIYVARGRTDLMFRVGIGVAVIFTVSFLIGVRYGTAGVALAYALSYFGIVLYPAFAIPFRLIGIPVADLLRHLWPQLLITGAMAAACLVWLQVMNAGHLFAPWPRLVSGTVVGAFVYILLMVRTRPAVIGHLEEIIEQAQSAALIRAFKRIGLFPEAA